MNSVNKDLEFTMELCTDFEDSKLPTLSFSLYMGETGIEHTYFEKSMKNQVLVMERSALGRQQVMSIMTNEVRRRVEVIGDKVSQVEANEIIDKYTQQLVNSGFNWKQCRDIIVSGLKGQKRKIEKIRSKGKPIYRSGQSSLLKRVNKSLLEKYNWFRKVEEESDEEEEENVESEIKRKNKWSHYRKRKEPIRELEKDIEEKKLCPPKAVIFVPNTVDSRLANEIRETVQNLRPWTSLNLKVVERAGEKLQDILCKSNPWGSQDCKRDGCFTCEVATKIEGCSFKNCRQRSIIYETWCETCKKRKQKELKENKENIDKEKKRIREHEKENSVYRYIGETSRSSYERGSEHKKDLKYRRTRSHLLRHCVEAHENEDPDEIEFGMKVVSSHKTSFERQLAEAVLIENNNGPYLLNSKLEYSRCNIPKMQLKLDDNEEKVDHLKEKERKTVEKIKMKYKKENKRVTNDDDVQIEVRQTKRRKKQDDIENGESDEKDVGTTEGEIGSSSAPKTGTKSAENGSKSPDFSLIDSSFFRPDVHHEELPETGYFETDLFKIQLEQRVQGSKIGPKVDSNGDFSINWPNFSKIDSNGGYCSNFGQKGDFSGQKSDSNGRKMADSSDENYGHENVTKSAEEPPPPS